MLIATVTQLPWQKAVGQSAGIYSVCLQGPEELSVAASSNKRFTLPPAKYTVKNGMMGLPWWRSG